MNVLNFPQMLQKTKILLQRMNELNNNDIPQILIVDDSQFNIVVLTLMLQHIGIDLKCILKAANGEEALRILKDDHETSIKVIFMDIEMPEIDGYQATQIIKTISPSRLNIIAYTSLSDPHTIIKCRDAGMDYFLSKPCNITQVCNVIYNYYFL